MAKQEKDPVCGMMVDPNKAKAKSDYRGNTYYFCAKACKTAFDEEPEKYLGGEGSEHGGGHSHH